MIRYSGRQTGKLAAAAEWVRNLPAGATVGPWCPACRCNVAPGHVPHSVACREAQAERDQSRTE